MSGLYENSGHSSFVMYKKEALEACKDLNYPAIVYKRVEQAKSEAQIEQIIHTARNTYLKD